MTRHSIHDVQHPTAENPDDGIVARAIDLTKVYGSKDNEVMALDHVNVEFKRGEMTAIMGPSGSGKSTLMHCMAGLDTPSSGKVIVEGLEVSSMNQKQLTDLRREQIGFIFQSFNLVPTLSAEENILLPLQTANGSTRWSRWSVSKSVLPTVQASCPAASSSVWPAPAPSWHDRP